MPRNMQMLGNAWSAVPTLELRDALTDVLNGALFPARAKLHDVVRGVALGHALEIYDELASRLERANAALVAKVLTSEEGAQ